MHPLLGPSPGRIHRTLPRVFSVSCTLCSEVETVYNERMSSSEEGRGVGDHKKYAGVRRRKWGKWVSEIRVPGTQERLWLGSYSSPEGAAVAHDVAMYCLRGQSAADKLNFPLQRMPSSVRSDISPRSVQKAASDAGMAVDASFITNKSFEEEQGNERSNRDHHNEGGRGSRGSSDGHLTVSVDDYL
ncbi:hypothetical protein MLD38_034618 [Melastoma candidum]|uniref:Uncharacterized protein n=1 Tax=Melastoma candidum TaxID=119954 RepID=A0ACB9MA43_9MYRT|nr:hypothetical protein MLD38_034618 [Melastoma candidum]